MSASALLNPRPALTELRVGGLARLSTCDWPGQLVATVFCQGCGWDCGYCHNPHLRPMGTETAIPWSEVMAFLTSRRGLLDGVVFSGGEPLLQAALPEAIEAVRELGYRIGLHTGGVVPERFIEVLPLVEWVGLDVKAPFELYARITGVEGSGERARQSLQALLASGVEYEIRTTLHPALLSQQDMLALREELLALGVKNYAVQQFRSEGVRPEFLSLAPGGLSAGVPEGFGEGFERFVVR